MHSEDSRLAAHEAEGDSGLLDLLHTLFSHWRLLTWAPLIVGGMALGVAFLIPPSFTARTSFFPPQQQQSSAVSMLQSLGPLGGLAGATAGLKQPADQYIALLKSSTLQGALVDRFELKRKYGVELREDALDALKGNMSAAVGKDGLIALTVSDSDPVFAAKLANAYVDELHKLVGRLALTEAQQRRLFFEKQLLQTKTDLTQAELAFKKTGVDVLALKSNPASAVNAVAQLQAQVTAQEVRLASLRGYVTDSSAEVKQAQAALAALRREMAKISRSNVVIDAEGDDYIARYRDVKYHETLFELFAKQFELAKVDEARDGPMIQVVDEALPPGRKSKPKRGAIAITAALGVWAVLVIFVLTRQAIRRQAGDPVVVAKLARLRQAWR